MLGEVALALGLQNTLSWQAAVLVVLVISCLAWRYFRIYKSKAIAITVGLILFAVGAAALYSNSHLLEQKRSLDSKEFELVQFTGTVDSSAGNLWRVSAQSIDQKPLEQHLPLLLSGSMKQFGQGCEIVGTARIVRFDGNWLLKAKSLRQDCTNVAALSAMRRAFEHNLRGVTPDAAALVSGMAIGETATLSQQTKTNMKRLSLTHLTAVSGANCAYVLALVYLLLGRVKLSRSSRILGAASALWFFVALVGAGASVVRAATMATFVLAFSALGRKASGLLALCYSVVLLLIMQPRLVEDLGFQLSVLATGALLVLAPKLFLYFRRVMPRWLAMPIAVALAAQLWCFPVLLFLQGGFPTYSVLANLVAEPVVGPITILGLFSCLTAIPFPLVSSFCAWLASIPAAWVVYVSEKFAALPSQVIPWPSGSWGLVLAVAGLLAFTALALRRLRISAGVVLAGVLAVLLSGFTTQVVGSANWPIANWQIANCNVGQGDALVLRSQSKIAVIDVGKEVKPIDDCLKHLGVSHIDLLVLTHFDLDHVGGLAGALEGRSVDKGMLTSFSDTRPQALAIESELTSAAHAMVRASAGMKGSLGSINWLVLQPEAGAVGSEDSNDGSIAMRWDAPDFTLYSMADLPEKGQMRLAEKHLDWLAPRAGLPVILKVSHHGSADQYPEMIEYQHPAVALISVGAGNPYGHPTTRTLGWLAQDGAKVFRTDQLGGLSLGFDAEHRPTVLGGG
mgnify:CR=1 FL=1